MSRIARVGEIMRNWRFATAALGMAGAGLIGAFLFCASAWAEDPTAYEVVVKDVTAKVGEPAVMVATLKLRDGLRILEPYRNRVHSLSSLDDGVEFDKPAFAGEVEDRSLVFHIALHPSKPGKHPINGVFRVGYIQDPGEMSMVSLRLIANVTGTD